MARTFALRMVAAVVFVVALLLLGRELFGGPVALPVLPGAARVVDCGGLGGGDFDTGSVCR